MNESVTCGRVDAGVCVRAGWARWMRGRVPGWGVMRFDILPTIIQPLSHKVYMLWCSIVIYASGKLILHYIPSSPTSPPPSIYPLA